MTSKIPQADVDALVLVFRDDREATVLNRRPSPAFKRAVRLGLFGRLNRPGSGPVYQLTAAGKIELARLLAVEEADLEAAAAQSKLQEAEG